MTTAWCSRYSGSTVVNTDNSRPRGAELLRRSAVVAAVALLAAAPAGAWTWPLGGPVVRPFANVADPYAGGQHRGIDVAGGVGSTVRATAAGVVSFAGAVPGYGRVVTIRTADGYAVTHAQLGSVAVEAGATVAEGDSVGTVGPSADPDQPVPHVHLGVRVAAD